MLGIPQRAVRIIPSACGGGFGGKLDVSVQPMLAVAAWLLRPAGAGGLAAGGDAWPAAPSATRRASRARAGCDAAGRLTGLDFEGVFDTGAYASWGPTVAGRVPVHSHRALPACRMSRSRARAIYTNNPPAGAFRGFGVPQAAIAQEALLDRLADAAGLDRLEFRRRQRAARRRRHRYRPGARALAPGSSPASRRCGRAGAALRRGRRRQCAGAAAAARRRHRLHVVRHRQYRHVQPLDHAGDARAGRAGSLPSTAPSISARAAPRCCCRSPPMRWACR